MKRNKGFKAGGNTIINFSIAVFDICSIGNGKT